MEKKIWTVPTLDKLTVSRTLGGAVVDFRESDFLNTNDFKASATS